MKATQAARFFLLLIISMILVSCDKNRDTFLNRNYQNMVARFNIYFNGNLKLEESKLALERGHADDFTKVLDVFPYGTESAKKNQTGQMDEVIKKASRIISERPISKWVDDAYFLMGKAYFFKADYFAAIETFQFLNSQYKGSYISYDATLWIIKSYVMLGKSRDAEAIIGLLNNDPKFPKKLKPRLNEVSAFVYIKEEKYKAAAENMEKAIPLAKGSSQKARYHYILAQLYEKLGDRKNARENYRIVTRGTPPYEMAFNAKINLAKNYNPQNKSEVRSARRYLKGMLNDDKNISYYSQIYYELGMLEKNEGNINTAIENFLESNNNNKGNLDHKAKSYLELADIYFNQPNYRNAQLYYDSAVFFLKPEFKDYDQLKAKQEVLSDLIKNLILIQREDSLLKVAALSPNEIEKLVDKAIKDEEKRIEEENRKKEELKQKGQSSPTLPNMPNLQAGGGSNTGTGFYFADPMQVSRGFNEFTTQYGQRENVDNWQFASIANKALMNEDDPNEKGGDEEDPDEEDPKKQEPLTPKDSVALVRQRYTKDLPMTPEAKQSSKERIAEALLNIGEIYFEQLKDYPESEKALMKFIKDYPDHNEIPKALFYLQKIKTIQEKKTEAEDYTARLIRDYPNSPYTRYLTNQTEDSNPEEKGLDKEIINTYKRAYEAYLAKNYSMVLKEKDAFDTKYYGSAIQPKFDLLEAYALAKIDSVNKCILVLEDLVVNYPTSKEALEAQKIIQAHKTLNAKKQIEDKTSVPYLFKPNEKHYLIMIAPENKSISMNQVKARFSDFNKKQVADKSFSLDDLLVGTRQVLLVKEFENKEAAENYMKLVESDANFVKSLAAPGALFIVGDPKNIGLMIVNTDMEGFLMFTNTYYGKK